MKRLLFVIAISAVAQVAFGQAPLKGIVKEKPLDAGARALPFANVYWTGTTIGVTTDGEGRFTIPWSSESSDLVVRHVGYQPDTLTITEGEFIVVVLKDRVELDEVTIEEKVDPTLVSFLDPVYTEKITEGELKKAACCNLSESFETNPSVDVSFTDAVTGMRTIRLLGLDGPYIQMTKESTPGIRGLASIAGLTFIPGPWVKSMQLMKGSGSVANGFESIAGQINIELKKPEEGEKFYLNVYGNQNSRLELNTISRHVVSPKFSTALLVHGNIRPIESDRNDDGFQDVTTGSQINVMNRWKYTDGGEGGVRAQWGVQGIYDDKKGGELDFNHSDPNSSIGSWGMRHEHQQYTAWGKIGYIFPDALNKSIGLQVKASHHRMDAYFGNSIYDGIQNSVYANLMMQNNIRTTDHLYRVGLSYQMDDFDEQLDLFTVLRTENVPGAFAEYTYKHLEVFTMVMGLRADYNIEMDYFFATPRLHLRYAPTENWVFRLAGGRGVRSSNFLTENIATLASAREWRIQGLDVDGTYRNPFRPENAWNIGGSVNYNFTLNYREGSIRSDFYHTRFVSQVVLDREDPRLFRIYALDGKSYSNSFQVTLDYEVVRNFEVRLAYRWYDVKTTYSGQLLTKPLLARNRAFANLAYETRKRWSFDLTANWQGGKRIPPTDANPEQYRLQNISPDFVVFNAQVSKRWKENFEIYIGMENIGNFRQLDPILASDDPFGEYFDATLVWGPIVGRNTYAGLRWMIN